MKSIMLFARRALAKPRPDSIRADVVLQAFSLGIPCVYNGPHPVGSSLPVRRTAQGIAYVEIRDLPASEVLVLANR